MEHSTSAKQGCTFMKLLQGREQVSTTRHSESFLNPNVSSAFANGNMAKVLLCFQGVLELINKTPNILTNFDKIEIS